MDSSTSNNNNNNENKNEQQPPLREFLKHVPSVISRARSGEKKLLNISPDACKKFGFYFGDRVLDNKGRKAWVVGVPEDEKEHLFFWLDDDVGGSYYGSRQKKDFEREGFKLISPGPFRDLEPEPLQLHESSPKHKAPEFEMLLDDNTETFTDVAFLVGNSATLIKAHRGILMARSLYFKAMFSSGLRESRPDSSEPIRIGEIDEKTFRTVLKFLYTGTIIVDKENMMSLLEAAYTFQIDDLKGYCLSKFSETVGVENVIKLFLLADSHSDMQTKEHCKHYIISHYEELSHVGKMSEFISSAHSELIEEVMHWLATAQLPSSGKRSKEEKEKDKSRNSNGKKAKIDDS